MLVARSDGDDRIDVTLARDLKISGRPLGLSLIRCLTCDNLLWWVPTQGRSWWQHVLLLYSVTCEIK